MVDLVNIALLILCLFNILLHSTGVILILKSHGNRKIQLYYILHLSIAELCINILHFVQCVTIIVTNSATEGEKIYHQEMEYYFELFVYTLFSLVYYFCMLFITLDRLLACWLTVQYPNIWNTHKARCSMYITWFIGVLMLIFIASLPSEYFYLRDLHKYFYIPFDSIFVVSAVVTYSLIFHRHKKAVRRRATMKDESVHRKRTTMEIFRNSKFHVPSMLIVTFILFVAIPDLVYLLLVMIFSHDETDTLLTGIRITQSLSYLIDGIIYIFFSPSIRKLLSGKKRLRRNLTVYRRKREESTLDREGQSELIFQLTTQVVDNEICQNPL